MSKAKFPQAVRDKAASIVGKRARIVIDVILEKGFVTTEDLKDRGYNHPPRAIKDVTDQGLPLVRSWSKGRGGRKMASYAFGDPSNIRNDRVGGRLVFSKEFKDQLIQSHGSKCAICSARLDARYLQGNQGNQGQSPILETRETRGNQGQSPISAAHAPRPIAAARVEPGQDGERDNGRR